MKKIIFATLLLFVGCTDSKVEKPTNSIDTIDHKFGEIRITPEGDTLFYVYDVLDPWVSSDEWHGFYEHYKEEIESIEKELK